MDDQLFDQLKDAMREAGYSSFSISEENNLVVLRVEETLYGDDKTPRFWGVLDDLGLHRRNAGANHADFSSPFKPLLPTGRFEL